MEKKLLINLACIQGIKASQDDSSLGPVILSSVRIGLQSHRGMSLRYVGLYK